MPAAATGPFLERLDAEARALLLSVARQVSFMKGAQLVRHGEPARGAWLLREGFAEAVVMMPGGEALTVAQLEAGSVFGEMALLDRGDCTATVSAVANIDGWFVERDDFRALVAQRHPAALRIQHAITLILSDKLRQLNAKVLACPSAEDRPARTEDPAGDPLEGVPRSSRAAFDWRAFLPRLPMFEGFDANEIDDVAAAGSLLELPRGAPVFLAGQAAGASFLIVRGAVEVVGRHGDSERRLAVLGPGQLFGFMSMLEGLPHGVSCYARESALLLELTRPRFEALYLGASPVATKLHRAVHRSLLGSLAQTNRRLTRLISQLRLSAAHGQHTELSAAYHGQLVAQST
jgi:CRP-like cAMP-binding protein